MAERPQGQRPQGIDLYIRSIRYLNFHLLLSQRTVKRKHVKSTAPKASTCSSVLISGEVDSFNSLSALVFTQSQRLGPWPTLFKQLSALIIPLVIHLSIRRTSSIVKYSIEAQTTDPHRNKRRHLTKARIPITVQAFTLPRYRPQSLSSRAYHVARYSPPSRPPPPRNRLPRNQWESTYC